MTKISYLLKSKSYNLIQREKRRAKLTIQFSKCAFLGYAPNKKGFLCYDPDIKRIPVSMNVVFFSKRGVSFSIIVNLHLLSPFFLIFHSIPLHHLLQGLTRILSMSSSIRLMYLHYPLLKIHHLHLIQILIGISFVSFSNPLVFVGPQIVMVSPIPPCLPHYHLLLSLIHTLMQ